MWSIVSSMKLLRKPSKRGEGDTDRKSSKDQLNGGGTAKVERRESARLSCGASKFLRSLRSGAHSVKENREQVNVIALKELDSENIDLDVRGQDKNPVFRLPERSQSFQERRLLVVTSKSSESPTSNGNLKIKHSRAQSFVCNSQGHNSVPSNPNIKLNVNLTEKLTDPIKHCSGIKDKRHALRGKITHSLPCETIYENMEVIREQKSNRSSASPSSSNYMNLSTASANSNQATCSAGIMKDAQIKSEPGGNRNIKNGNLYGCDGGPGGDHPSSSRLNNYDKDCDRRSSRNSTKDSGYETNLSDYMNCDVTSSGSSESVSLKDYHKNAKSHDASPKCIDEKNPRNAQCNGQSQIYSTIITDRDQRGRTMDNRSNISESRKLRRSISEVPSDRLAVSKLQSKSMDGTRAVYSSNGLSVWNVEKTQKEAPIYGVYHHGSSKNLPAIISTLPRRSSECHIAAKSTPSLKNALEISVENRNSNNKIYHNVSAITSARSTPNLQGTPKQLVKSFNHIYEIPRKIQEHRSKLNGAYSSHNRQASFPTEKHPGLLVAKNLKKSNDSIYKVATHPSTSSSGQDHKTSPSTSNMSNNVGNNVTSWVQNDPVQSGQSSSPTSGAAVRDTSSLKQIRYGPGHEKYPSWPVPVSSAAQIDPVGELNNVVSNSGSSRSKSWTEQTDYPKEKAPSYARPYMKRMNQAYTQQLKTVMEKCERIPPETFDKSNNQRQHNGFSGILPPPVGYRDMYNGNSYQRMPKNETESLNGLRASTSEKEYNIPSPPERDVTEQGKPFPSEDLELYAKKYEEMMNQYAQSEGYHSYISSECSSYISSGTPFLDQLRRESESNQQFWSGDSCDPNDPLFGISSMVTSGRESVTTVVTNSSSNSSGTETLKWHGSTSDLSTVSGPGSITPRVWENQQNIAHSAKVSMPQKHHSESVLLHNGPRHNKNKLESQNSLTKTTSSPFTDSQTPNLKKFPLSTYTRPTTLPLSPDKQAAEPEKKSTASNNQMDSTQTSPIIDTSKPPSVAERILELEQHQQSTLQPALSKQMPTTASTTSPHSMTANNANDKFGKSSSLSNLRDKAQPQHSRPHATTTNKSPIQVKKDMSGVIEKPPKGPHESYPGFWTNFNDTNTIRSPETNNSANIPISYTYLDPEKKHRVADMTLKAIQKKALLSYYERHTGKSSSSSETSPRSPQAPGPKHDPQVSSNLLEKDSPFPTNRLTLSLPRDIDRIKEPHIVRQDDGFLRKDNYRSSDESSRSSSHPSMTGSTTGKLSPSSQNSSPLDPNNMEKSDAERTSHSVRSLEDLSSSDSARMAYMSKYLPHLVNRDATNSSSHWSGVNVRSMSGASTEVPTKEPAPVPPERPPKKPHLRNMSQQANDNGKNLSPPPPLPRAPVRQPATAPCPVETAPPPVPNKPLLSIPRCMSPDLPPPPPPPVFTEEEVEVINDAPLPPPPTMTEVQNLVGSRSRSASGLSSYLHKDSYLAQRKERTLGYEGRYRRTLSPSGLGSKSADVSPPPLPMTNATSTGKLESTLSPSAWEKYHNIRAPSTTVIFTSNEIAKSTASSQPVFHRSISWDSNLFNNKTGFSQASTPPPVAQVAPLRGASEINRGGFSHASLEELELLGGSSGGAGKGKSDKNCASLSLKESDEEDMHHVKNGENNVVKKYMVDSRCQTTDSKSVEQDAPMSMTISPLRFESGHENKENIPICGGLKKSEITLRVNCTSDASSQTDSSASACSSGKEDEGDADSDCKSSSETRRSKQVNPSIGLNLEGEETESKHIAQSNLLTAIPSSYTGRQKSNEELECDELSRDLAKQLPQGDKLQSLLVPLPEHKTPADYIEGLFPLELKICVDCTETKLQNQINLHHNSSIVPEEQGDCKHDKLDTSTTESSTGQDKSWKESDDESSHKRCNGHAPLPADSAYFTTSESKAKFLTQYVKDMHNESISGTDSQELNKQKEELVSRISRKLEILRTEQLEIREEIQSNEHLGHVVIERVKQTAKRNEFDKFKLHVEEIEKITSLLLGLSGRLARAENALMGLAENSNPQEKKILESKRDKLKEQLDEAKILKESIDRRSAQVSGFLQKYLTVEEYADYHHFVKMKAKLIIDSREIDDKIKLGDEQMMALQETLSSSS